MSKKHAIIIQFVLPLTTFYRPGAQKSNVYKRDVFVTSWRFHNRTWQLQRHDRLPETSGTLWIHRGALTNQRCSLATGCGIKRQTVGLLMTWHCYSYGCYDICKHSDWPVFNFVYIHTGKKIEGIINFVGSNYNDIMTRVEIRSISELHDDVIKWKHFPRYWPFVQGIHRSLVNSPHKGQWGGALMFTLICARINGWVNNREAGDLGRYHPHYDVIVM